MAKRIQKIPFPDWLLKTDCNIKLYSDGISEDGEPISNLEIKEKCIFSEKSKRIISSDGKEITLLGKVIVKGDIAPNLKNVSDGEIIINDKSYEIYTGYRPRNPDGTIHHTEFELK
jgi:hypothetical protein